MQTRYPVTGILLGALCGAAIAAAAVIDVPSSAPTIQDGVDSAAAGDTVLVAPGTYFEIVEITSRLFLISTDGPDTTQIVGGLILTGEDGSPFSGMPVGLEGFTIVGGGGSRHGIQAVAVELDARRCIVLDCTGHGAMLSSAVYHLTGCVFAGNGSNGLLLSQSNVFMTNCTVMDNGTTGVRAVFASVDFDACLLAFNGGYSCQGLSSGEFNCCDIYGNESGDWFGELAVWLSLNGNISWDPLFCSTDPVGDRDFSIQDDSPCVSWFSFCDIIGAGQVACEVTATLLSSFSTGINAGRPEISWAVLHHSGLSDFRLEGSLGDVSWPVPFIESDTGVYRAVDTRRFPAVARFDVTYTLSLRMGSGWSGLATGTVSLSPAPLRPRLTSAHPNPFNPQTSVFFEVDEPQHLRISVHDLTGRRVATLANRRFDRGSHDLVWRGVNEHERSLPSGVYFVRLVGESGSDLLKISLIR